MLDVEVRHCECGCERPVTGRFAHGHYLGNGRVPRQEFPPKDCECGCGQPAPVAARARRGYRKGEPMRFVRGHFSRTDLASPPPVHFGEENNKWGGDAASIESVHKYLKAKFPKVNVCEQCGTPGPTDYANIHGRGYTRKREDYRELCRLCHNRYDIPLRLRAVAS